MKRILVVGANGATGIEVVKIALANGYRVSALVRNKSSIELRDSNLSVYEGDVLNITSFNTLLNEIDSVISCLGQGSSTRATELYSKGIRNIISAMSEAKVNRLVCISAGGLYLNDQMGFPVRLLTQAVIQKIFEHPYRDLRLMEEITMTSEIDWTIVRPPMLTDGKLRSSYRTSVGGNIRKPFSISRKDLAHFLVQSIGDSATVRKIVEVSY